LRKKKKRKKDHLGDAKKLAGDAQNISEPHDILFACYLSLLEVNLRDDTQRSFFQVSKCKKGLREVSRPEARVGENVVEGTQSPIRQ